MYHLFIHASIQIVNGIKSLPYLIHNMYAPYLIKSPHKDNRKGSCPFQQKSKSTCVDDSWFDPETCHFWGIPLILPLTENYLFQNCLFTMGLVFLTTFSLLISILRSCCTVSTIKKKDKKKKRA